MSAMFSNAGGNMYPNADETVASFEANLEATHGCPARAQAPH